MKSGKWTENEKSSMYEHHNHKPKLTKEMKKRKRRVYSKSIATNKLTKQVVCNILKEHYKDLKDDPERLRTKFLQNLIGVKCKRLK